MGIVLEQGRQFRAAVPGADDRRLADVERLAAEGRHERERLEQPDVPPTRLVGVVEWVRVEYSPDELPREVLQAEP